MDKQSMSYVEKLEHLYVLMETQKLLEAKRDELISRRADYDTIEQDLVKIKEEMNEYTDGQNADYHSVTGALFNPALLQNDN
ncbi:hypothetical protein [Alkalihalobacterium bogoriense]|uniref:hypothetical protein n=1 Tax=Alkalihalobacterium bogoriense TaxID=246272 RepID=UPI000479868B|nr:hypothetical protein [Alkalihalobacterium bogoriense]